MSDITPPDGGVEQREQEGWDMKNQIKFWIGWAYQIVFGLMMGFLVGFLVVIKPKGSGGILRNSDTLPFVLGMGLLFVTLVTQFCYRMDRGREGTRFYASSEFAENSVLQNIKNILSILIGITGVALMVMSLLRTYKIMPR